MSDLTRWMTGGRPDTGPFRFGLRFGPRAVRLSRAAAADLRARFAAKIDGMAERMSVAGDHRPTLQDVAAGIHARLLALGLRR